MPVTVVLVDEEPLVRAGPNKREAEGPRRPPCRMPEAGIAARPVPGATTPRSRAGGASGDDRGAGPGAGGDHGVRVGVRRGGVSAPVDIGTDSLLAGVRIAEYDPRNTRTSWKDGRWGS
ncbi:hypothetical protein [Streptomyces sp. 3330]|uniref:hypothetical protein n=1 Tax=Streptomyces sp. 3330 TaxID=2817755 RepID=UPI00286AF36A|nr:hypothetical protein [Streptomyces sp. 3330]